MSGLLALLDDVAAIAKVAASSVDDIAANAAKAGSKTVGVVVDDAAVTPKYVTGFDAERELPIIWKITRGSIFNKMIILLPALLFLDAFAPMVIPVLLILGGCYLCFEGAEKVVHMIAPHPDHVIEEDMDVGDPAHLEEERVSGAVKTDFILSGEIMVIALSALPDDGFVMKAASLALIGLFITALVYGSVALIVKMDDIGLAMARKGRLDVTRTVGQALVRGMPTFLKVLSTVGTLAMLWVGGSIIVHSLHNLHLWDWPYETVKNLAKSAAAAAPSGLSGFVTWFVTAFLDAIFGLILGVLLVPFVTRVLMPIMDKIRPGKKKTADQH